MAGLVTLLLAVGGCRLPNDSNPEFRRPALLRVAPSEIVAAEPLRVGRRAVVQVSTVREPTCARVADGITATSPTRGVVYPATATALAWVEASPMDLVQLICDDESLVAQPRFIEFTPTAAGPLVLRVSGWAVPGDEPATVRTADRPLHQGDEVVEVVVADTVIVQP